MSNNVLLKINDNTHTNIVLNHKFQKPDSRDYKFVPSPSVLAKVTTPIKKFCLNQKNIITCHTITLTAFDEFTEILQLNNYYL